MLKKFAQEFSIDLSSTMEEQFDRYTELLTEYNQKFNLTAITEPDEIKLKHFADCMACAQHIPQEASLADVGSGAGFPGLVIKIIRPDVNVTLMDSLNKRIGFLKTVTDELGLDNVECIHIRAEDAGRDPLMREAFDVVTSRAVANMSTLSEYSLPLIRCGGIMLAMKGRAAYEELEAAADLIGRLGGKLGGVSEYTLPGTDIVHTVVRVGKTAPTPKTYPRKGKKIGM